MAAKLIDIKEAAEIMGVTPDQLNEMRSRGEIHGYRDGGSWKFKTDEVERVINERGNTLSDPFGADDFVSDGEDSSIGESSTEHDLTISPGKGEQPVAGLDDESILVSAEALGHSAETTSSTVIGKGKKGESAADSDIQLASEPLDVSAGGSDVALVADVGTGSDVKLVAGGSDVLVGGSGKKKGPSDTDKLGGNDLALDDDPVLSMGSSLTLGEEGEEKPIKAPGGSSGAGMVLADDDDMVLGGSGGGSDLTLGAGGSGINLKPTDSGLSLEQPLELGGSGVESLELPEDDDMISLDDEQADPDAATQLKADDEFLLTPVEESFADDESSGSQVIALEDSEAYADESAKTMLGPQAAGRPALEASASDPFASGLDSLVGPTGVVGGATAQPVLAPTPAAYALAALPEAPYSIWNVMALMFVALFLGVTGMLMTDLVRNIWSFDNAAMATTSLMDAIVEAFQLNP